MSVNFIGNIDCRSYSSPNTATIIYCAISGRGPNPLDEVQKLATKFDKDADNQIDLVELQEIGQ